MPIYEYRCDRGHTFEVLQRMTDAPVTVCASCDAGVQRVLHPVAVHFKGSGFYTTDYARKGSGSSDDSDGRRNGSGTPGAGKGDEGSAKGDEGSAADKGSKTAKGKSSPTGSASS